MRINELTGVKKYHNLTFQALIGQLAEEYNLKILGSGRTGTVLQGRDPNSVYKVLEKDDAYLSFVNFAMANPNPHFPRFEKVKLMTSFYKRYNIQPDQFNVIKMEKLLPLEEGTAVFASFLADVRHNLGTTAGKLPNGSENYEGLSYYELAETRPWIISLWEAIRSIQKSKLVKGDADFHPGNFMKRADHTIVISDPVKDPKALDLQKNVDRLYYGKVQPEVQGPVYKPKKQPVQRKVIKKGP